MNLIQELLTLREDIDGTPIPPRVVRLMRDEDIHYPGTDTLEKLKAAHARQLLDRDGGEDSAERALSYALGMNGLSKIELESMSLGPGEVNKGLVNQSDWGFTKNDYGFSGCDTLTGPSTFDADGKEIHWHIAHEAAHGGEPDLWELGAVIDGDPNHDRTVNVKGPDLDEAREHLQDWVDQHGLPHPTDEDLKKMGLL